MSLIETGKKATSASNSIMTALHTQKQKVVGKFKGKYLKKTNQNPDCFKIGNYIGVFLELAKESDRATLKASSDEFVEDKNGNFYAVIGQLEEEKELPGNSPRSMSPYNSDSD